jgi:hypothetical protein
VVKKTLTEYRAHKHQHASKEKPTKLQPIIFWCRLPETLTGSEPSDPNG